MYDVSDQIVGQDLPSSRTVGPPPGQGPEFVTAQPCVPESWCWLYQSVDQHWEIYSDVIVCFDKILEIVMVVGSSPRDFVSEKVMALVNVFS